MRFARCMRGIRQNRCNQVNLQGVIFDTNDGGRLPFSLYLNALIEERTSLEQGSKTLSEIAIERQLSPKYLQLIDRALSEPKGQLMASIAGQLKSSDPNCLSPHDPLD